MTNSHRLDLASSANERRWGKAVDSLTPCPNRDAPVLPPEPCKFGSGPITGNEPLKWRSGDSLHASNRICGCSCRRIEINFGALATLSLMAIVVLSSRKKREVSCFSTRTWARARAKIGTANVYESSNEASCAEQRKTRGYYPCVRGACKRKSGVAIHA